MDRHVDSYLMKRLRAAENALSDVQSWAGRNGVLERTQGEVEEAMARVKQVRNTARVELEQLAAEAEEVARG